MTSTINTEENLQNEIYDKLLNKIKLSLPDIKLDHKIIFKILKILLELIDIYEMTGEEKKQLVLKILRKYVDNSNMSNNEKELCNSLITDGTLSETINIIISAARGEFDIKDSTELGLTIAEKFLVYLLKKLRERRKKKLDKKNTKLTKITN
tara:strand:- start:793 stop:1248 length:456 start_codon:yes stop_codon:yes gene_type:complete